MADAETDMYLEITAIPTSEHFSRRIVKDP